MPYVACEAPNGSDGSGTVVGYINVGEVDKDGADMNNVRGVGTL